MNRVGLFRVCFCSLFIVMTGCQVGPEYHPPTVEIPDQWKNDVSMPICSCYQDYWWEVFQDPILNELEQQLLSQNFNLKSAYDRVQQARGMVDVARSDFYPQLSLSPIYNNEGILYESYSTNTIVRSHQLTYLLPVTMSWEIDLWGKLRDRYDAANEQWEGQIDAYYSTMLVLTSDLAALYFQIRTTDAQIKLFQETINNREIELRILKERFKWKIVDYFDVAQGEYALSSAIAQLTEMVRVRAELENRIAVLIGLPASEFCFISSPLEGTPPEIPVSIPSEILKRRPDIAEAERMVAAEHSLTKAAYASFFPNLFIYGRTGSYSMHSRYFFKKKGRLWGIGADSSQTLFDGGKLIGDFEIQNSLFMEASDDYKQKVLMTFAEVEDSLSNIANYQQEYQKISDAVAWSAKSYTIANKRFKNGVTSFLDVVVAQQQQLMNQIAQNNLLGQRFISTIQLIKVIGGSWDCQFCTEVENNEAVVNELSPLVGQR